ncbi:MAG: Rieske 2Fe-2S domain-containing protein [Acidimicrobiia bacterium]
MQVQSGWFEGAGAVNVATAVPARVGELDLVVWRDGAGVAHANHAHCPHLGAHLGYGGTVHDTTLRCPFHGWGFDPSGVVCEVPYSTGALPRVQAIPVPVAERASMVFVWLGGDEPFALPTFPWFEREDVIAPDPLYFGVITATVDDFVENAADTVHFETVHGVAAAPVLESATFDGPIARFRTTQQYATPRGPVAGRIDIDAVGPGITYTEYTGLFDGGALATFTPRSDCTVEFSVQFRFAPDTDAALVKAFVEGSRQQINRDIALWSHRVHHETPALERGDGPILELREWISQFR